MSKVFAIRNKDTGEFISYNNKCGWKSLMAANLVFGNHTPRVDYIQQRYDDQDKFEIIELSEYYHMYKDLCK